MKSAILMTAYQNFDVLEALIEYYCKYYSCYIHVDKKATIPESFKKRIKKLSNVKVVQNYRINWGSYKHVSAFLLLLKYALDDGCDYFHLIPADTFPVKSISITEEFFQKNKRTCFIEQITADKAIKERQKYFYFQHLYNLKSDKGYLVEKKLIQLEKKVGISRRTTLNKKGYIYCHISKDFAEYVHEYVRINPSYFRKLKLYSIAEEFFFQNLIDNGGYYSEVVNDHLIFDDWSSGGGGPAVLSKEQIDLAFISNKMFARKISDLDSARYILSKIERGSI